MSRSLFKNRAFVTLYAAQTINLLGDALTWVGLALLSYDMAGISGGSALLATVLTLRVTAFVLVSPWAGLLADRVSRKKILLMTHVMRMGLMSLLPFVHQPEQLLAIVFGLNVFNGIFSPTYKATLPLVTGKADYQDAIVLSGVTYQLLSAVGPGVAGLVSAFVGVRQVFFLDAITFAIAAVLVISIPNELSSTAIRNYSSHHPNDYPKSNVWRELNVGTMCLWRDRALCYGLLLQLIASLSGAQILINTVRYVQGTLHLGTLEYGWVMAAFGAGATIGAMSLNRVTTQANRQIFLASGCILLTSVMLLAQGANLWGLMTLWAIAGVGQSMIDLSIQMLIADRVSVELQGRVYGAHFAWSHLWWVIAYPSAGFLSQSASGSYFLMSGAIGLSGLLVLSLVARYFPSSHQGFWHEHGHSHTENHVHTHSSDRLPISLGDYSSDCLPGHSMRHSHYHFHVVEHSTEPI